MEQQINDGQFVVLAKGNWKTKLHNARIVRDNQVKGTVDIKVAKLAYQSLIPIDKFTLDVFPGVPAGTLVDITIPDFLGAVTGNRFCFVYRTEETQRIFVVYNIDEKNKKVSVTSQFVLDNALPPTAIIAIKDKVFLGFPGQVGYVDLTKKLLSLKILHTWQEQTESDNSFRKTIDAFAFDSSEPKSLLIAIDDVIRPKYAFTYKITGKKPKYIEKLDLPSGSNEHYTGAVTHSDRLILTAKSVSRGGKCNSIEIIVGSKAFRITESVPHEPDEEPAKLFVGSELTELSSVGLLDGNVILVTAGTRGVIAIPMNKIKAENKLGYNVPTVVKNLHIGTSASELVTVKEKSTAFVLGTTDNNDKHSVLSQLKWNSTTTDLEVVCSHHIEGSYDRLFMEVPSIDWREDELIVWARTEFSEREIAIMIAEGFLASGRRMLQLEFSDLDRLPSGAACILGQYIERMRDNEEIKQLRVQILSTKQEILKIIIRNIRGAALRPIPSPNG